MPSDVSIGLLVFGGLLALTGVSLLHAFFGCDPAPGEPEVPDPMRADDPLP